MEIRTSFSFCRKICFGKYNILVCADDDEPWGLSIGFERNPDPGQEPEPDWHCWITVGPFFINLLKNK